MGHLYVVFMSDDAPVPQVGYGIWFQFITAVKNSFDLVEVLASERRSIDQSSQVHKCIPTTVLVAISVF